MTRTRSLVTLILATLATLVLVSCQSGHAEHTTKDSRARDHASARTARSQLNTVRGIHKIKHVVVIMQENRSFDSYFGTYPGADGIAMRHGQSVTCLSPGPGRACHHLYADHADVQGGGPHAERNFNRDLDHGRMDGFLAEAVHAHRHCTNPNDPVCSDANGFDTLGYHTRTDIPNYWTLAHRYVLQDHMFEPIRSWSSRSTCGRSRHGRLGA